MALLEYSGEQVTNQDQIRVLLNEHGITAEFWGTKASDQASDDEVLNIYKEEIDRLNSLHGYVSADVVSLSEKTENLDALLDKFKQEHHHSDDEVRFTISGQGVFEIRSKEGKMLKITTDPGDLIVVPKGRKHLFYLTDKRNIRCVRLFKDTSGWEALFD